MSYQDFPWQKGGSLSFKKLTSLSLPPLQGKKVLDVGCNEGYFSGWASFQRASFVKGIDKQQKSIEQARIWFPQCRFSCIDWCELGSEKYDLIICLSAIHYAADQQQLIDLLMSRLEPDGLLVLELGIADGEGDEFIPITRNITATVTDTRLFPTHNKMHSLLDKYSSKYMGSSVMQAGDPVPRHVYHVCHTRPYAILLMDGHYAGKTSFVEAIICEDIFRIRGEGLYHEIADGKVFASDSLKDLIQYVPGTKHMIPPQITENICTKGLLPEFIQICRHLAEKHGKNLVLEHYIPYAHREKAAMLFHEAGYFVVDIAMYAAYKQPWYVKRPPHKQYVAYQDYLERLCDIDEEAYLAANPDVAQMISEGKLPSARYHYWYFGRREKRKLS
ncbi:MAG: methyltransferase domain-containing protein [Desulfovibrio sp.]|nr:methyltransferase domain-containing protein [Desulfovibrio sp.]